MTAAVATATATTAIAVAIVIPTERLNSKHSWLNYEIAYYLRFTPIINIILHRPFAICFLFTTFNCLYKCSALTICASISLINYCGRLCYEKTQFFFSLHFFQASKHLHNEWLTSTKINNDRIDNFVFCSFKIYDCGKCRRAICKWQSFQLFFSFCFVWRSN